MNGGTNSREVSNQNMTQYINSDYMNNKLLQDKQKLLQDKIVTIHSKIENLLDKKSNDDENNDENHNKYCSQELMNYNLMFMLHNLWMSDIYHKRPYNCYDCYMKLIKNQVLLDPNDQKKYFKLINDLIYYKNIYDKS